MTREAPGGPAQGDPSEIARARGRIKFEVEASMKQLLIWAVVLYFMIGLSLTAFCVHMSYHEAAVGFGDNDDFKVQKVLESKMGPLGFIFLFTFWPIALFIAFRGRAKLDSAENDKTPQGQ
jgi:hypothetical protein